MLTSLISSSARIRILKLFLMNPENRYYIRQIVKLIHLPIQAVQRETNKLCQAGIFLKQKDGNRVYFKTNKDSFLFEDLKNIIIKTVGLGETLRGAIKDKKDILFAFIFGSYAKNEENTKSDIDIAIIGNISSIDFVDAISELEDEIGREINPFVITLDEFIKKLHKKGHFISSIMKEDKIYIKGTEDEIRNIIKSGKDKTA